MRNSDAHRELLRASLTSTVCSLTLNHLVSPFSLSILHPRFGHAYSYTREAESFRPHSLDIRHLNIAKVPPLILVRCALPTAAPEVDALSYDHRSFKPRGVSMGDGV